MGAATNTLLVSLTAHEARALLSASELVTGMFGDVAREVLMPIPEGHGGVHPLESGGAKLYLALDAAGEDV